MKEVKQVYIHETDELLHLYTSVGTIDTTSNHPFYVLEEGWAAAGDLTVGDEIYQLDGSVAVVTCSQFEKLDIPVKVYNLEVEDFHSYFVGHNALLIHNSCTVKKATDEYGNTVYDVELSYKDGWSASQKEAAQMKVNALSEATTVKTKVEKRKGGSATSRYKKYYGSGSVLSFEDVDHIIDLQLGGLDEIGNMSPLDSSVNRSLGSQISHVIRNLPYGTVFRNFTIS